MERRDGNYGDFPVVGTVVPKNPVSAWRFVFDVGFPNLLPAYIVEILISMRVQTGIFGIELKQSKTLSTFRSFLRFCPRISSSFCSAWGWKCKENRTSLPRQFQDSQTVQRIRVTFLCLLGIAGFLLQPLLELEHFGRAKPRAHEPLTPVPATGSHPVAPKFETFCSRTWDPKQPALGI